MTQHRVISCAFLLFSLLAGPASAHSDSEHQVDRRSERRHDRSMNTLTLAPLSLLLGRFGVEYERALGDHASIFLAPNAGWLFRSSSAAISSSSWGVDAGARFFFLGHAPSGLWGGPQVFYSRDSVTQDGTRITGAKSGFGLMMGGTLILFDALDFSVGAGLQYIVAGGLTLDANQVVSRDAVGYAAPIVRASMGFAF